MVALLHRYGDLGMGGHAFGRGAVARCVVMMRGRLIGWKGDCLVAVVSALLAGGAAWTAQGWRKDAVIADLRLDRAQADLSVVRQALATTEADITRMADAARAAARTAPALTAQMKEISKALENANPLPAGCRPDADRVRSLTDAVRATNRAAAGQSVGDALP